MRRISWVVLSVAITFIIQPAQAQTPDACSKLVNLKMPDAALEINKAKNVAAAPMPKSPFGGSSSKAIIPAHCRVDGVLESRIGVNKVQCGIGFAIALPADWNGRFLFQGGGGLNGAVQTPMGAQGSENAPALARGFAIVSTESGHKGSVFDASFFRRAL